MINGISRIGGLLPIFKIGVLLSWIHQKLYEKKLMQDLKNKTANEELSLKEIKSIVSIENFIKEKKRREKLEK